MNDWYDKSKIDFLHENQTCTQNSQSVHTRVKSVLYNQILRGLNILRKNGSSG